MGPERHESLFVLFRTNRINTALTICNCPKQGTRQRDVAPKRPNSANSRLWICLQSSAFHAPVRPLSDAWTYYVETLLVERQF